jgi:predicted nucleotidyltransferase
MENKLEKLAEQLKKAWEDNLVSLIIYGSAVRGDHVSGQSNINLLIILKEVTLETLSRVERIFRSARHLRVHPVFWTLDEIASAKDVFPIEFADIAVSHRVLLGADPFQAPTLDKKNLRHQLEFELRSKLQRMRTAWFEVKGSRRRLREFLVQAGTSFGHLFKESRDLAGGQLPETLAQPFLTSRELKHGRVRMNVRGLERLYHDMHDAAVRLIRVIDQTR